jgi:hypothetical protein
LSRNMKKCLRTYLNPFSFTKNCTRPSTSGFFQSSCESSGNRAFR